MAIAIKENVALAPHTTMGVGGPARFFAEVESMEDLQEAIKFAHEKKLPIFMLGGGSNIIISDEGFEGLVISGGQKDMTHETKKREVFVTAGAGIDWDVLAKESVAKKWAGIENLSGVPGTVGGAVVQNIGCYGQTLSDVIDSVGAVEVQSGEIKQFTKEECRFKYRSSRFKSDERGKYIITSATLRLALDAKANPDYLKKSPSLKDTVSDDPSISEMRAAILKIRAERGHIITEEDSLKSVGSFFLNPILTRDQFEDVKKRANELDSAMTEDKMPWYWPESEGKIKVSAAFLMEFTSFKKGHREGNVGISPRRILSIINLGKASAAEIVNFAKKIRADVDTIFAVKLETEPLFVGFDHDPLNGLS